MARKKYTYSAEGLASMREWHKNRSVPPAWKGGRTIISGYVYIYSPEHPNRTKDKYVCEHRLVMEKKLGRYLKKEEVVHHINHNRLDNSIENLMLLPSTGKHYIQEHCKRDTSGKFTK